MVRATLRSRAFAILAAALTVAVTSCAPRAMPIARQLQSREARELVSLVSTESDGQRRAVAVERLSRFILGELGPVALRSYLTTLVEEYPDDPYGGFYLYLVGRSYNDDGDQELAKIYFERALRAYPDVEMRERSLHLATLQELVVLTDDQLLKERYLTRMVEEYPDSIDLGRLYYQLARSYEALGRWEEAYRAYRQFLAAPPTTIPGSPDARLRVNERVRFYDSSKDWLVPEITDLVARLRSAIARRDTNALKRYEAKVNFFTRTWEQDSSDPNSTPDWDIGALLQQSRVIVSTEIEIDSDGNEAYLETDGWGQRITKWYLYFRKVDFPADPELNGSWEWAGVYLGARL